LAATLRRVPAVVAFLLLGAHYLRGGQTIGVGLCLLGIPLLFVRRAWLVGLLRTALLVGTAVWLWTAWQLMAARRAAGEPYLRMLLILLAVAGFTALSAWMLPRRPPSAAEPSRSASGTTPTAPS